MKKYLILPIIALAVLSGCRKMTPAEMAARDAGVASRAAEDAPFKTTCISGYKFTYNYYSPGDRPVQILNGEGHGIACE